MKKQYIFLIFIVIILYLLYLIIAYKYKEYKINTHMEIIQVENNEISNEINEKNQLLEYYNTKAYKNKILKEEQWLKNKDEVVIFITNEDNYNKYTKATDEIDQVKQSLDVQKNIYDSMTIFEKWIYFLFKKDIR